MKPTTVRIEDCAEVRSGFSAKGAIESEPDGAVQVITAQHLRKGEPYLYREEHTLRISPSRSTEKYHVIPGDILFMSRGANNYAVLIADIPQPAIAPLTFYILKPKANVLSPYLAWCINQEGVRAQLNEIRTGAGTPLIPRREFGEIVIPLPPLEVQRRIAAVADLQARERSLLHQLVEETERLHRLTGQQLLSRLAHDPKE
ncbi:restriction endonuclease subunit S [Geomonas sp. RF6]|uniref:restriction endonuclease subunit S n=1 Tax=Geomonas sp. RF6 TaxID=2897342 RepID=UPI001E30B072|nr:restriction endonuclease subunit S [Geomonas sp. RF6]UFS72654.1 restriction endonuclease subunit S [Geomonas sp. RF6]